MATIAFGQGYKIEAEIQNFEETEAYLGYYYGDKQYLQDTAQVEAGKVVFEGQDTLDAGMYLLVLPPDNRFIQFIVTKNDQQINMSFDAEEVVKSISFKQSKENKRFYEYMNFISDNRAAADKLRAKAKEGGLTDEEKEKMQKELDEISGQVKTYQLKLIEDMPGSFTAALIRSGMDIEAPTFEGTDKEKQYARWRYFRKHWFDNIAMDDPRLLRSPTLFQKVNYYMTKMTVQHPDSLAQALDTILYKAMPSEDNFKFFLIHYINEYAKSKYVGMDAIYVHLVDHYYAKGKATWTDEEQLIKMLEDAKKLRPTLIGKTAPNIFMETEDREKLQLHDVEAPYIVMLFWDTDCSHCKKAMPKMVEFEAKFREKGVKIFAVCSKASKDFPKCWEYVKEKGMENFINVVDPYLRYKSMYDVRTTPRIYILDDKKEIVSKGIGAEQLEEVMDKIIEIRERQQLKEQESGE